MKRLSVTLIILGLASTAFAQSDNKAFHAVGVVSLEIFPGRPNYESNKAGDEAEEAWILTVTNREKSERFQLVAADGSQERFSALRHYTGKKVLVTGTVWEAQTGHHHAGFLIPVRSIQEGTSQPPEPTPPTVVAHS